MSPVVILAQPGRARMGLYDHQSRGGRMSGIILTQGLRDSESKSMKRIFIFNGEVFRIRYVYPFGSLKNG